MMKQDGPSKSQILANLRSGERDVLERLGTLPPETFETGCYESGWTGREVLAHIASIEWTYPRLIGLAAGTIEPPKDAPPPRPADAGTSHSQPLRGGINDYNQRQVERLAGASVPELIETFRKNRAATIAAVESVDEALLAKPVRSAGGISGPLATVLHLIAVRHVNGHVNDIAAAAGR